MASVNDYLKKLLYQYDCIVVPELGAFLTHYQSAAYTESSGLFLPPRKRVAFNEALRFDDGILINYVTLHEPLTREGALQEISLFVTDLRKQVETTGRFDLEGIGTFTKNEEGSLQFSPGLRQNFFGESFGMGAVPAQLVRQQPQPEPALEAVPVLALGPVLVPADDAVLTPYRPARQYWRVAAAALLIGSLGAVSYFSVIKPGQPFQSSLDPANLLRIPASLFFPDDRSSAKAADSPETTTLPTPESSLALIDAPAKAVAEATPAPPEPAVTESVVAPVAVKKVIARSAKTRARRQSSLPTVERADTGPHFTVIAGVFMSKRNALSLRNQLRNAGYPDAFVILPGRGQKEMYKVGAAGSANRDEAVAQVDSIKALTKSEPWIPKN